ncbi:hypothetical protein [Mycobacterium attenuatum]|uniref:hypothetical protein n=1 Tax=Mycobacterium attenuatum TaxID=2341086 RepID=UPI000F0447EA|nr:hypothetical protein [Mycobacterium attenuatum]VBA60277.1 hypothetical protein LAUMK41_03918 [Mycobacterium attenuatum]
MRTKSIRIKVVDSRGRTVAYLGKRSYFKAGQHDYTEPWAAHGRPVSEKRLAQDLDTPALDGRMEPSPLLHGDNDRRYLPMPNGLPLRLDKVAPMLERLALTLSLVDESGAVLTEDQNAATLTVEQLRSYAR